MGDVVVFARIVCHKANFVSRFASLFHHRVHALDAGCDASPRLAMSSQVRSEVLPSRSKYPCKRPTIRQHVLPGDVARLHAAQKGADLAELLRGAEALGRDLRNLRGAHLVHRFA